MNLWKLRDGTIPTHEGLFLKFRQWQHMIGWSDEIHFNLHLILTQWYPFSYLKITRTNSEWSGVPSVIRTVLIHTVTINETAFCFVLCLFVLNELNYLVSIMISKRRLVIETLLMCKWNFWYLIVLCLNVLHLNIMN